jgi:hypothetical protein
MMVFIMSKEKIKKNYVSPLDQFISQFDQEHPVLSASQIKEKAKFARIYKLRDVAASPEEKALPDDF